jgi:FAD:protein FMN transferase
MGYTRVTHLPHIISLMIKTQLLHQNSLYIGQFTAMASPCELLMETDDAELAKELLTIVSEEAYRIQHKFSRYERDNIVWAINNSEGHPVSVDAETALLLNFAEQCHSLSDGLFDITSGSLGRVWKFDGSTNIPTQAAINEALHNVGWDKVTWQEGQLQLPVGMQIDFGGIGKEYAVDRCLLLLQEQTKIPFLVNFGGDLAVNGPRLNGNHWTIGIERPDADLQADYLLEISAGALATSGDSRRYLLVNNTRYSHILNPFTGWPITHAPRSITVAGANCIQAGMLATFGLLKGKEAEVFLEEQGVPFWILR